MTRDQLTSWTDGETKARILGFVRSATTPGDSFVPVPERVATFDNDGTLWCEKPTYAQADFLIRRWKEMGEADPSKLDTQPWKAVAEGDKQWLSTMLDHLPEVVNGVAEAYGDISTDRFEEAVRGFFDTARHPTFAVSYPELAYRPMVELIDLLHANGFGVYICSGGGRDFIRVVSEEMYRVPRERVIGTGPVLEYRRGEVIRTKVIEQPIDDGPGKPVHIWKRTGRLPILAGGNADGDAAMLESAQFALLVRHDDSEREFAYDAGAEQSLAEAQERGWTVISMKDDFKTVF